jgi:hypothetical protein
MKVVPGTVNVNQFSVVQYVGGFFVGFPRLQRRILFEDQRWERDFGKRVRRAHSAAALAARRVRTVVLPFRYRRVCAVEWIALRRLLAPLRHDIISESAVKSPIG